MLEASNINDELVKDSTGAVVGVINNQNFYPFSGAEQEANIARAIECYKRLNDRA